MIICKNGELLVNRINIMNTKTKIDDIHVLVHGEIGLVILDTNSLMPGEQKVICVKFYDGVHHYFMTSNGEYISIDKVHLYVHLPKGFQEVINKYGFTAV